MALLDTPWCGSQTNDLFLTSGKFSSTILTSISDLFARGITYDGIDTYYSANNSLYLMSGQFSSTIKTSETMSTWTTSTADLSFDGANVPWITSSPDKLFLISGVFSTTLLDSQVYANTQSAGVSYDKQGNTPACGFHPDQLMLVSGQFTSTIITSLTVSGDHKGISYDGTDTILAWDGGDRLLLTSGQITSTVITSQTVSSVDTQLQGICTNDFSGRTGAFLGILLAEEQPLTLALPAPTIIEISNPTITPDTLGIGLSLDTAHINSNVARPEPVSLSLVAFDPIIEFGASHDAEELSLGLNVWSPTLDIITQTIVTPDPCELTATFIEAIAAPDWAIFESSLPMFTLNASILDKLNFASDLPMLTLEATCITGQIFSVIKPLPMLTLDIRAGTKVDISLPMLTLSASGTGTNGGRLTKPLPLFTLNASGKSVNTGILTQNECGTVALPMFTVDIVMALGGIHAFESTFPMMTLNGIGITGGDPGLFVGSLPIMTLGSAGYSSGNGALVKSLPMLTLNAFGTSYANRII